MSAAMSWAAAPLVKLMIMPLETMTMTMTMMSSAGWVIARRNTAYNVAHKLFEINIIERVGSTGKPALARLSILPSTPPSARLPNPVPAVCCTQFSRSSGPTVHCYGGNFAANLHTMQFSVFILRFSVCSTFFSFFYSLFIFIFVLFSHWFSALYAMHFVPTL